MARKTLLNESEIRRFMKLASISPLKEGYMTNEDEMEEGKRKKKPPMRAKKAIREEDEDPMGEEDKLEESPMYEKDEDPMDEGLFEQEEDAMVPMDDPMPEPMDEPEDMGGAGASEQERAMEEAIAAIIKFAEMSGGKVDVQVDLEDGEEEEGGEVEDMEGGDEPDESDSAPEDDEMRGDEEDAMQVMGEEEEIVAEVARRVANRLLKEKKTEAMANKLAESIFRRLSSK